MKPHCHLWGRRLEEMAAGTRVITVMGATGWEEEQSLETNADHTPHWVHRPAASAADPEPILRAVSELKLPSGPGFIWIAAEQSVAHFLRSYFLDTLGHPPEWLKASAYWSQISVGHQ